PSGTRPPCSSTQGWGVALMPTKTYSTSDGKRYVACTIPALVRQLWEESCAGTDISKGTWRDEAAVRAQDATGRPVRSDSDTHFIQDLIDAGLIKETEE